MKIIMRADDLGMSEGINYGILKTIQEGVINSVGLMPNMVTAGHGVSLVKGLNIALGQHTNISVGKPISDPSLIPSLVNEKGEFYSSHEINARSEDTINIQECEYEIEAQLHRFIELTGHKPDYFEGHAVFADNFIKALSNVAKKYDLFYCDPTFQKKWCQENGIINADFMKLDQNNLYDPQEYFETTIHHLLNEDCILIVFHPGYLDQYVLNHSSFTLIRPLECEFLCCEWLKNWLNMNDVELVDFRNYR